MATTILNQTEVDRFQADGRDVEDKNLYEQTFVQCMRLWEDQASVRPFTFHPKLCAADANETEHTRRVFTMAYMKDGCRRSRDDAHFSLDRDQIKTGERIEGPGFPVAWPRASGDLPAPPVLPGPKTGFGFPEAGEIE